MRSYEMMFIVHPEVDGDQFTRIMDDVEDLVERNGGDVTHAEPWGLRKLAYPVQKQQEGRYALLRFDLEPQNVNEVDRALQLIEPMMRHLIVRAE